MDRQRGNLKENPAHGLWRLAKQRSKNSGMPFTITEEDIQVPEFCPVLGCRLEFGTMDRRDTAPSLDRVDSSRGYVPGNVAVISWRANKLKNDGTAEEHQKLANWINDFQSMHSYSSDEVVVTRKFLDSIKKNYPVPFGSREHKEKLSKSATDRWARHRSEMDAQLKETPNVRS